MRRFASFIALFTILAIAGFSHLDGATVTHAQSTFNSGEISLPISTPLPSPTPVPNILVNSTLDILADDGQCTLREATKAAMTGSPSGSSPNECPSTVGIYYPLIEIPAGHYPLTLRGGKGDDWKWGDLDVGDPIGRITLRGAGTTQTIIDGMGQSRVFDLSGNMLLEDLSIINGQAPEGENGGGIRNISYGGWMVSNSLTLSRVAVRNNRAGDGTATQKGGNGGGIAVEWAYLEGDSVYLIIEHSEISNNDAGDGAGPLGPGDGGGMWIDPLQSGTIRLSTISGNHVDEGGRGGGIYWDGRLEGVTITDNWIGDGTSGMGGGVYTPQGVSIRGVIIANNHAGDGSDCRGTVGSDAGNLIGDPSNCGFTPWIYDQVGIDPLLGPLVDNGGFGTYTHALMEGSPAIDNGLCAEETMDQRGLPRPVDIVGIPNTPRACDVGALERQVMPGDPTVTPTSTITPTATPDGEEQMLFLPLIQR